MTKQMKPNMTSGQFVIPASIFASHSWLVNWKGSPFRWGSHWNWKVTSWNLSRTCKNWNELEKHSNPLFFILKNVSSYVTMLMYNVTRLEIRKEKEVYLKRKKLRKDTRCQQVLSLPNRSFQHWQYHQRSKWTSRACHIKY